jgi:membrane protease subunit HflK
MTIESSKPTPRFSLGFLNRIAHKFPIISLQSDSPWGNGTDDDGKKGKAEGGKKPPVSDNPWSFPQADKRPGRQRPQSTLDQILQQSRARMGGGGGLPTLPNGRPLWPILGLGFVAIWLLWTSVWRIDAQEQGVVTLFGSYSRTVGSGINFTLPAPFETLEKVDVGNIRPLEIGSTAANSQNLVLTRDQNLIDLAYTVRWSIRTPSLYKFQIDDPETTIRDVAETAMRASVANYTMDEASGTKREDIERDVQLRMQTILNRYRAGVQIQSIAIRQTDPPLAVNEAFKQVTSAQQKAQARLNDARTFARQTTEIASGEAQAFDKVYEEYRLAPEVTKRRMYYDTMERVLSKIDKTIVEANGVTPYLPLSELRRRAEEPEPSVTTVTAPRPANGQNSTNDAAK